MNQRIYHSITKAALLLAAVLIPSCAQSQDSLAFEHVNVITMADETVLMDQRVLIANGKIQKIEPQAAASLWPSVKSIDAKGKYLIPGLSEMHYHWRNKEGGIERDFKLMLANGITTARNMGEYDWQDHIGIRKKVAEGQMLGPNYYTTGPYLQARDFPDSAAVVEVVRTHLLRGYDFLKLADNLPRDLYVFLLEEAEKQGVVIMGHGQRKLPLEYSLRMKSIEHVEEFVYILHQEQGGSPTRLNMDDAFMAKIARQVANSGIYVAPTLLIFESIIKYLDEEQFRQMPANPLVKYMLAKDREYWLSEENLYVNNFKGKEVDSVPFKTLFQNFDLWIKKFTTVLAAHKVPMLTGSDTYGIVIPGFSLHEEMKLLADQGLSPYEVLHASTVTPARYLNTYSTEGTISEGKTANLVLLSKNPLDDISHTSGIEGVMLRGQWLDRPYLDAMLQEVVEINGK